jgi:hypothetical protein
MMHEQIMTLVIFSSNRAEIETASQRLSQEGIVCQVRNNSTTAITLTDLEHELWVEDDRDWSSAMLSCMRAGIGFCRHAAVLPIAATEMSSEEDYQLQHAE